MRSVKVIAMLACLYLPGCKLAPSRFEPYRKWLEYCKQMSERTKNPHEALKCVEAIDRATDEEVGYVR